MKCVIIEDEIPAQRILKAYIAKLPELELVETFNSALKAYDTIHTTKIDLIFLDINLPDISGLSFLKTLKEPPYIIMTTAYPDYAVESFEFETIVDYLVKPFSLERFIKAIHKVKNQSKNSDITVQEKAEIATKTLFLNVDKTLHNIVVDDILYVESERNYLTLVTIHRKFSFIDALKNWIEKLPENTFIQVHKSYIVNYKMIDKISGNLIYIKGCKIPIGRTYKPTVFQILQIKE